MIENLKIQGVPKLGSICYLAMRAMIFHEIRMFWEIPDDNLSVDTTATNDIRVERVELETNDVVWSLKKEQGVDRICKAPDQDQWFRHKTFGELVDSFIEW